MIVTRLGGPAPLLPRTLPRTKRRPCRRHMVSIHDANTNKMMFTDAVRSRCDSLGGERRGSSQNPSGLYPRHGGPSTPPPPPASVVLPRFLPGLMRPPPPGQDPLSNRDRRDAAASRGSRHPSSIQNRDIRAARKLHARGSPTPAASSAARSADARRSIATSRPSERSHVPPETGRASGA